MDEKKQLIFLVYCIVIGENTFFFFDPSTRNQDGQFYVVPSKPVEKLHRNALLSVYKETRDKRGGGFD
jgi:hypothetical protein